MLCWHSIFHLINQESEEMELMKTNEAAIGRLRDMIRQLDLCILITTGKDGQRHNRPMAAVKIDDNGDCWFFASKSSGKLRDISSNNKLQVIFANPAINDYVELHGVATVDCNEAEIMDKWSPLVNDWFPGGIKDPEVCLVRVEITNIFYWDEKTEGIQRLSIKTTTVVDDQRLAA
jgi:general stress protein 26